MRIAFLIARILLGLIFTIFGLNGFLHFIPAQMPTGIAGQYVGALAASHYMVPVFVIQLIGGLLLLVNRFVPFAVLILGPVLVNILLFHIFMAPQGLPIALVTTLLWVIVFSGVRRAFAGVFVSQVKEPIS